MIYIEKIFQIDQMNSNSVNSPPLTLEDFSKEIEKLLGTNQLDLATKRLSDLVEEFTSNRELGNEAINFQRRYHEANQQKRQQEISVEDFSQSCSRLTNDILDFLNTLKNTYQTSKTPLINVPSFPKNPSSSSSSDTDNKNNGNNQPSGQNLDQNPNPNGSTWEDHVETLQPQPIISQDDDLPNSQAVFYCEKLIKKYKSSSRAFKLSVDELYFNFGEITALVGENGNGKTTLLRIIAAELVSTSGRIKYPALFKVNSRELDYYQIRQQIAYIPQSLPKWPGTLLENLHFSAAIHGVTGKDNEYIVERIIWRLGLQEYKKASWHEISGGYRMRFALAKALVWNPKLLILDEPLANLDVNAQSIFLQDLRYFVNSTKHPKTIIISSQHLHEVERIADKIIFMQDGKILYNGKIADFDKDRETNAFELECQLSFTELTTALKDISNIDIEIVGYHQYIIYTERRIVFNDLLRVFIDKKISLLSIRDISQSTRRLFKVKK